MKKLVYFGGFNGYDYYGHWLYLAASKEDAEYEIVLNEGDVLTDESSAPATLVRGGKTFTQITRMNTFNGVAFVKDAYGKKDVITCKLIKIKIK